MFRFTTFEVRVPNYEKYCDYAQYVSICLTLHKTVSFLLNPSNASLIAKSHLRKKERCIGYFVPADHLLLLVSTSAPVPCSSQPFLSWGMSLLFIETLPIFRRLGDLSRAVIAQTSSFMMLYYSGSLAVNQLIQVLISHVIRTSLYLTFTPASASIKI